MSAYYTQQQPTTEKWKTSLFCCLGFIYVFWWKMLNLRLCYVIDHSTSYHRLKRTTTHYKERLSIIGLIIILPLMNIHLLQNKGMFIWIYESNKHFWLNKKKVQVCQTLHPELLYLLISLSRSAYTVWCELFALAFMACCWSYIVVCAIVLAFARLCYVNQCIYISFYYRWLVFIYIQHII